MNTLARFSRTTLAATALGAAGLAQAADYSKTMWSYATGQAKTKPVIDSRMGTELIMQMWAQPAGVPTEALMFMYMPKRSPEHWAILLVNPKGKAGEFVGARQLIFLKAAKKDGEVMNMYRLGDGMFKNLYLMEGNVRDRSGQMSRLVMLLTPQLVEQNLDPKDLLD
ncbi:hypothetical protein [Deinococcus multiflagellatus]|uniref:Uncharacterized protein n=1 Tax=Deinococcus multiflagellatus TaxID=1656887 RepID=A0ABW1ZPC5_9DEIO|nr:hypothetical protein [Deinococcus multiflagellatus]MBZ9714652.1 hypothetical protein [Deinococcus multiflagellatus]